MTPQMPIGCQVSIMRWPGRSVETVRPCNWRERPTAKSQMSIISCTSPCPSETILPASMEAHELTATGRRHLAPFEEGFRGARDRRLHVGGRGFGKMPDHLPGDRGAAGEPVRHEGGSRNTEPRENGARFLGGRREDGIELIGEGVRHHGLERMNGFSQAFIGKARAPLPTGSLTLKAEAASIQPGSGLAERLSLFVAFIMLSRGRHSWRGRMRREKA